MRKFQIVHSVVTMIEAPTAEDAEIMARRGIEWGITKDLEVLEDAEITELDESGSEIA